MDYCNPSLTPGNGHLPLLENGQDIGSIGMRAQALGYDGKPIATYVS